MKDNAKTETQSRKDLKKKNCIIVPVKIIFHKIIFHLLKYFYFFYLDPFKNVLSRWFENLFDIIFAAGGFGCVLVAFDFGFTMTCDRYWDCSKKKYLSGHFLLKIG